LKKSGRRSDADAAAIRLDPDAQRGVVVARFTPRLLERKVRP
jgi:hypothetical protein